MPISTNIQTVPTFNTLIPQHMGPVDGIAPPHFEAAVMRFAAQHAEALQALSRDPRNFDPNAYTRTPLGVHGGIEYFFLAWLPGQQSSAHDHAARRSGFLVLQGACSEEIFTRTDGSRPGEATHAPVVCTDKRFFGVGELSSDDGLGIHRVTAIGNIPFTTLHAFAPSYVQGLDFRLQP